MNKLTADLICCSCLIGIFLLIILISLIISKLLNKLPRGESKKVFKIDNGETKLLKNGDIVISRDYLKSVLILFIILGFLSSSLFILFYVSINKGDILTRILSAMGAFIPAIILIYLAQKNIFSSLMLPQIRISTSEGQLEIISYNGTIRLPISDIKRIQFRTEMTGFPNVWISKIEVVYIDDTIRNIGSISGDRTHMEKRVHEVGQMIKETTNLPYVLC